MSLNAPKTSNDSIEQIPRYKEDKDFTIHKKKKPLGFGGQATVYQGNFRKTATEIFLARPSGPVAIKKFNTATSMDMAVTSTEWREIEILIKANNKHPRIVQLFGITIDKYDKTKCSGYIMEYMQNGSLDRVIHDKSIEYDLNQIYSWLQQAAYGIVYLHKQNIIHRDIKPSNLLLGKTLDDLKVADFGFARHTLGKSNLTGGIGTYGYMAPEVFITGKYNNSADVYSFTTTIWEIFHRKEPLDVFKDKIKKRLKITEYELTKKVIEEGWHPTIESSCIEPDMKRLLRRGWHKDPLQRLKFEEILDAVQPIGEVQPTVCPAPLVFPIPLRKSFNAPRTSSFFTGQMSLYKEGDFINLKRIGEGGQANVYQGNFRKTATEIFPARPSSLVAIKRFHQAISTAATSREWREIEILIKANMEHPRIVQLFGITMDIFDNNMCSGYIMEYMQNGSLDRVIHDKSIEYDLNQIYSWLQQAAYGIIYLHEQNIIHRDIKPSNLLLGKTLDDLKVSGFGLARHTLEENYLTGGIGTYGYTAPEVLTTGKYNNTADVYSFTTTIWEIFHRKKPLNEFEYITKYQLISKVIEGWHPAIESLCIEPDMERLLERGWHKDPLRRLKFKEILDAVQRCAMPSTILVLGGYESDKMHLLKGGRTQWNTLSLKLPDPLDSGGAVYLDGEIYIFGGYELNKKTYKLNREMKWILLTDMNEKRWIISNSSVAFDGCIWVFGGCNRSLEGLNSVEKHIPEENKWIQMPSMKEKRADAAAAACKGKLFVSGGYNGYNILRSIECFDPTNQIWTMFLDLHSPTRGHALISDRICITVLGGRGEERSVWKINPNEEKATWINLPQMRERRYGFTANLLGDNIFAIGGGERSKKVEFFYEETWEEGPELPEEFKEMCSIVIPGPLAAALSSPK